MTLGLYKNSVLLTFSLGLSFILLSCGGDSEVTLDCAKSGLVLKQKKITDINCSIPTGTIEVTAEGGTAPYRYDLAGVKSTTGIFSSLPAGKVTINVADANLCESTLDVEVKSLITLTPSVSTTANSLCLTNNGSITVSPSSGKAPYQFALNDGSFGSVGSFSNMKDGSYIVKVKDAEGCIVSITAQVSRGNTGISFANEVKAIIDTNCNVSGCHNGNNGESRNYTVFQTLKNSASSVKERTANKSMPPSGKTALTADQIAKIACWVDDGAANN